MCNHVACNSLYIIYMNWLGILFCITRLFYQTVTAHRPQVIDSIVTQNSIYINVKYPDDTARQVLMNYKVQDGTLIDMVSKLLHNV